ncbi:hypothetical protein Ancab_035821 [Ancistrocladus abbreviatus]
MAAATAAASTSITEAEKPLREELSHTILLAERLFKSAEEAESSKLECLEIANRVDKVSNMLHSVMRLVNSPTPQSLYERPIRRFLSDVSKNLDRAQIHVRRCRHTGLLKQLFSITTLADFKKVMGLLESSIADLTWLLSIFDGEGANLGLPPITGDDPILAWVWSHTASLEVGRESGDRIDSANYLASLAKMNDRNKKMIVEEGAVPRLLKLLKDGRRSADGQIAAANALSSLVDEESRTRVIVSEGVVPLIVQVLGDSPVKVQIAVADLVARIAEIDKLAREAFGTENVMKPLVSCLSIDLVLDDRNQIEGDRGNLQSIFQVNKELTKSALHLHIVGNYHKVPSCSSSSSDVSSVKGEHSKKERENETPEVKYKLKTSCALALHRLCEDSLSNSRKIAEGKGLLCLSKMIETEKGELQLNCLKTVMEIAAVAESNTELRKGAWKPSSLSVKALLDQLMRVIQEESNPDCQVPAIRAIGCLARIFSAREKQIIDPLVAQLGNNNTNVATEAAIALGKFVCQENHIRVEHSKTIIELEGVPLLMGMLRAKERAKLHGLVLLCHLSVNVGNSKALVEARALRTLEGAARSVVAQNPDLRELFAEAIHRLRLIQAEDILGNGGEVVFLKRYKIAKGEGEKSQVYLAYLDLNRGNSSMAGTISVTIQTCKRMRIWEKYKIFW